MIHITNYKIVETMDRVDVVVENFGEWNEAKNSVDKVARVALMDFILY